VRLPFSSDESCRSHRSFEGASFPPLATPAQSDYAVDTLFKQSAARLSAGRQCGHPPERKIMEAFYIHIYSKINLLVIVAIGLSFASVFAARRHKFKLHCKLVKVAVVCDSIIAGIYLTSSVLLQYSMDILMAFLWCGLAVWNYRQLKR